MALNNIITKKARGSDETEYQVVTGTCDIIDMVTGMYGSWERRVRVRKWIKKCCVIICETKTGRTFDRKYRLIWYIERITGGPLEDDVNVAIAKLFRLTPDENWIKQWMHNPPLVYGTIEEDFNKWGKERPFEMMNMSNNSVKYEMEDNSHNTESDCNKEVARLTTDGNCLPSTSRELIENTVTSVIMENTNKRRINSEEAQNDLRLEDYEDGDDDAASLMKEAAEEAINCVLGGNKQINRDRTATKIEDEKTDVMDAENNSTVIMIDDDTDTDNETDRSNKDAGGKLNHDTSDENETRVLVARQDPEKYVRIRSKEWKELLETVKVLTKIANDDSMKAAAMKRKRDAEEAANSSDAKKQRFTTMNDICDELFGTEND